jgi:hypothetical protein
MPVKVCCGIRLAGIKIPHIDFKRRAAPIFLIMKVGGAAQTRPRFLRRRFQTANELACQNFIKRPPGRVFGSHRNARTQDKHASAVAFDLLDENS